MIFSYLSNLPQLLKIQCWWIWSGRGCRGYPFLAIQKSEVSGLTLQKAHNPGVVRFDLKKSSLWTLQHALKVNNDVQLEVNGFIWNLISNSISQVSMFIFILLGIFKKNTAIFPICEFPHGPSDCRQVLPEEFGIRICEIEAYADLQNNNRLEEGNFASWYQQYDGEVSWILICGYGSIPIVIHFEWDEPPF